MCLTALSCFALLSGYSVSQARPSRPPDTFKSALEKIVAASSGNFSSLRWKLEEKDSSGISTYLVTFTPPGFKRCRLVDAQVGVAERSYSYTCIQTFSIRESSTLKDAYERLIERVQDATGLTPVPIHRGLFLKGETYPGSGVFDDPSSVGFAASDGTRIEVSLKVYREFNWTVMFEVIAPHQDVTASAQSNLLITHGRVLLWMERWNEAR
jgi:hypothetical protein